MKQIVQNYRKGKIKVLDVPKPQVTPTTVLVRTLFSAVSAGTEKTKVDTGKMSLIQKAKSRPDLVKKVIQKAKKEGVVSTYEMVKKKLDDWTPMGYSAVGRVEAVGEWVEGVQVGDIVACAGAGKANHSEYNLIPGKLVAKVPDGASLELASFTTIGSIALQGIRQADPKMGERVVVLGLGLLGQITSHLLKANGCQVLGVDLDHDKVKSALDSKGLDFGVLGTDSQIDEKVLSWTQGRGADAVIVTASTPSNNPINQAGEWSRDKGRVVIVGAIGTEFSREPFYMKEVDIKIARSYGPGRYDPQYEELGIDYPFGFVRFTEQRNMETFLQLLAEKKVNLDYLITHRYSSDEAEQAFDLLHKNETGKPYLGILIQYAERKSERQKKAFSASRNPHVQSVGFIGLGNYGVSQILPQLKKVSGIGLHGLVTSSGLTAKAKADQFKIENVYEKTEDLIKSSAVDSIFILTRHDSHADLVKRSLTAGKNVFVEKPLCLNTDELNEIEETYLKSSGSLTVGFNRRFSPLVREVKEKIGDGVAHIHYRVNAGVLPDDHWLKIPEIGGGRILGEGCHFVDLIQFLGGSLIQKVSAFGFYESQKKSVNTVENVQVLFQLENGVTGSLLYTNQGSSHVGKEWIEVNGQGQTFVIDDFQTLSVNGKEKKISHQDKGQAGMIQAFTQNSLDGSKERSPISFDELKNSTLATFAILESLATGEAVVLKNES